MTKTQDMYLGVHPWKITEEGFHPDRSRVSESLFSLANEYQGVRGYFDEGYGGDTLRGVYLQDVWEEHHLKEPLGYKGIPDRIRFMANTVDWLYVRLEAEGEVLDLSRAAFTDFTRELDMTSGLLTRGFTWKTRSGRRIRTVFQRCLSMRVMELGVQRVTLTSLDGPAAVTLTLGLDFSMPHESFGGSLWVCTRRASGPELCAVLGATRGTGQPLFAGFVPPEGGQAVEADAFCGRRIHLELPAGVEKSVERSCVLARGWEDGVRLLKGAPGFEAVLKENTAHWRSVWETGDIVIDGDAEAQQGIRFCIFQLHQTCRGAKEGSRVGAKGLTGEAYNGHVFWDSEIYCLPYYLFSNPAAARSMLDFRRRTLSQAQERAWQLDCAGACFPVATIDGTESCTLWQHASLQLQPTTAVAYALGHYAAVTGDEAYLHGRGAELLVEICRFIVSRVQPSGRGRGWGFYGVMGPDEFHMMVHNNCYLNYTAKRALELTLKVLKAAGPDAPKVAPTERARWEEIARDMIIPRDGETGVLEQHDGFFDLPHIDPGTIPVEEFPLYSHWSYDRIYRTDMIKQPDVLMLMLLYGSAFSAEEKRAAYDCYAPRCIHESSLSPSVHSILASELGREEEAYGLFRFATRIDLDNYNRNTSEGLHMTSIAAAWMNIVYGWGGLRSDGPTISLDPRIPRAWKGYSFSLGYRGSMLRVDVDGTRARVTLKDGPAASIILRGHEVLITEAGVETGLEEGR